MAARELVDVDASGIAEFAHFDADGALIGLEWECDVEPVVEANKRAQSEGNRGFGPSRELQHVASIPPALLLKWASERGVSIDFMNTREGFSEIVMRMIKDPDYRWLRRDL